MKDTTDVLNKLTDLENIGDSLLVTMDIEALYTNIPHKDGLEAMSFYLQQRPIDSMPPTELIVSLTKWSLENNIFLFQDKLYQQVQGTAMGASYAPSYAGLFLGLWEKTHIYSDKNPFLNKIELYGRYIDDLFFVFKGSVDELLAFHEYINSTHVNLKLSLDYSDSEINFLDLKIIKDELGYFHTSIYRKSTDRNTILRADSFHPPHLIENIPLGQFQRLRRICDQQTDFNKQALLMTQRFKERGYNKSTLTHAYTRAKTMDRKTLLRKNTRPQNNGQIFFSTQYSTKSYEIKNIIKKNWGILQSDPTLKSVFPVPPMFSFRRAPTLKDKLVRSHLSPTRPTTWLQRPKGTYPCGSCRHCLHIDKSTSFQDPCTDKLYELRHYANCNTTFVVYRLECECGCFYIGRTKRRLKDRLAEHKLAIRKKDPQYPMAMHFQSAGHTNVCSLKVMVVETIPKTIRGVIDLNFYFKKKPFG